MAVLTPRQGRGGLPLQTVENILENGRPVARKVARRVAEVFGWQARLTEMQGVCLNCHNAGHVEGFYSQFDDLVTLYN